MQASESRLIQPTGTTEEQARGSDMARQKEQDRLSDHARDFVKYVCRKERVKLSDLLGRRKPFELMTLRGCLYAWLWYETDLKSKEVARIMNRTHSTVITEAQKYYHNVLRTYQWKDDKISYIKSKYDDLRIYHESYNVSRQ